MSTLKVDTLDTSNGTGNINVSRPLSGSGASLTSLPAANLTGTLPALDGSNLTGVAPTQATIEALGIELPAANLTGTVADARISTLTASKLTGALPAISGASLTGVASNTPQFYVYDENADISLTSSTWTKVSFPDTLFDADNVFDNSSTHRFTIPSGQAGKYVLATRVSVYSSSNNIADARVKIYKNGSFYHGGYLFAYGSNIRHIAPHLNFIEDAAVGDYYEVYIFVNATSPRIYADGENKKFQYFYGYKIG
jgi:hypothetical protein